MFASLFLSVLAFAATDINAEYEVPVPAELSSYSRFAMEAVKVETRGREVRVKYRLPLTLTGLENEVEMRGARDADGVLRLSGPKGRAECSGFQYGQQCKVKYENLEIDLGVAAQELDKLSLQPQDKAGFLEVAALFGGDMQGIIHYRDPVQY